MKTLVTIYLLTSHALFADEAYRAWFYRGGGHGDEASDYAPSHTAEKFVENGITLGLSSNQILELSKSESRI